MKTIFLFILFFTFPLFAGEISDRLQQEIESQGNATLKVWIFFKDKGGLSVNDLLKSNPAISEHALWRRSKVLPVDKLIDNYDLPLDNDYIQQLQPLVLKEHIRSKWLNALSATVRIDKIASIAAYPFVKKIDAVDIFHRQLPDDGPGISLAKSTSGNADSLEYGPSLAQLEQIKVTALHAKGLSGKGIIICMLDDGFHLYKLHETFNNLDVIATYDFIYNDSSVDDPDSLNQGWHGTQTLSVIGGYTPGELIGAAYGASFLLAKTEIDEQEIQIEEDNWVAGLEWAEARGADIVSSSLGYSDWYTWEDMDGKTAVTTLATNVAEQKGVIVVNSAGNNGYSTDHNTLNAPADGKYVVTVGGVTSSDTYWSASSCGPTADGRIKPDICALGSGVYKANNTLGKNLYGLGSGTSFACPLAAGAIALLLEAFPQATPQKIRTAIRSTGDHADNPDNYYGYGILNAEGAYNYLSTITDTSGPAAPETFVLGQNEPNPFNGYSRIEFDVSKKSLVNLQIYNSLGQLIFKYPERIISSKDYFFVESNFLSASGVYFYVVTAKEIESGKTFRQTKKMVYIK